MLRDLRGATAIEYGLLAGIISIGILLSTQFLADEVDETFAFLASSVATN